MKDRGPAPPSPPNAWSKSIPRRFLSLYGCTLCALILVLSVSAESRGDEWRSWGDRQFAGGLRRLEGEPGDLAGLGFGEIAWLTMPALLRGEPAPTGLEVDIETVPFLGGEAEACDLLLVNSGGAGLMSGGRLRGDYFDDFDGVTRMGGVLTVESPWRIGIDTEAYYWRERADGPARDTFWTGDFNFVYAFGHGTPVRFQSGVGFNWMHDGDGEQFGFNTTYGLDFHLTSRWVLSGSLDWGRLDRQRLWHGRLTAGLMLGRLELFAGYDHFQFGRRERSGPLAGVGLWF